jgi:hypothetical protein
MNRVKALEAKNATDELKFLSPVLSNLSKQMPYEVPADYFESLGNNLMQSVRESDDYHTAKEELATISPLLSGMTKQMPFNLPKDYFENLNSDLQSKLNNQRTTKIVSISSRKWFRYAAAAMVIGIIFLSSLFILQKRKTVDPNKSPDEWVAKNVKKVNADKIDDFIKLADQESTTKGSVANKDVKPEEMKELMKDVPENQIQDFLNETAAVAEPGDNASLN